MSYTESQLEYIGDKRPELRLKPVPKLDAVIVKFLEKFEVFVKKNKQKIVNLDYIIDIAKNSRLQNLTNYLVEKGLKTLRYFRKYS